jgi:hypothetical protein
MARHLRHKFYQKKSLEKISTTVPIREHQVLIYVDLLLQAKEYIAWSKLTLLDLLAASQK